MPSDQQSIKKNFAYSSILTVSTYIFPLITFPYVTRVLGVENIGICNFVDSVIQYFILFAMMGMQTMAIRVIAQSRGDRSKLSSAFNSLLALNLSTTFLSIVALFIAIAYSTKLQQYQSMFYIGAAKILFNSLLIEWFYKGIEDFKYITIRTLIVKIIYVILIFTIIQTPEDYIWYFAITVLMFVVNALVNIVYARKFVSFSFHNLSIKPLLKPFFVLGVYLILTSMYTSFNVAYLGFVRDETEVGYYSTATKLYSVILGIYSAFTGVMLPRMSKLISDGKFDDFKRLAYRSLDVLFLFSMPLISFSIAFAPQIVSIIAGPGFEGAILPMRIIMPLMIVIGYEQLLIVQILTPLNEDKVIFLNSFLGALNGILLNILIVKQLGAIGSSIVWILSEMTVLLSAQYFVYKRIKFNMPTRLLLTNIIAAIPCLFCLLLISHYIYNIYLSLLAGLCFTMLYFSYMDYKELNNSEFQNLINYIKTKIKG